MDELLPDELLPDELLPDELLPDELSSGPGEGVLDESLDESEEAPELELLEESSPVPGGGTLDASFDESLLASSELVLSELVPVLLSLDDVSLLSEPEGLDEVSSVSGVELEPVDDVLELVVPVLELLDEAFVLEPSDEASVLEPSDEGSTVISLLFPFSEEPLSAGSEAEALVSTSEPDAVPLLSPIVKAM